MEYNTEVHEGHYDDKSLKELLRGLSNDTTSLVRQESELFRREMEGRIGRVQREVTMLGAGGVIAHVGALALAGALILLLDVIMPGWVAALIVGAALAIAGAVVLASGRKKLKEEALAPRESIRSVKQDLRTVREAMR